MTEPQATNKPEQAPAPDGRPKGRIGPLAPSEWASFRLQNDDGETLPSCCAVVSDFRSAVFDLLAREGDVYDEDGNVIPLMVGGFRVAYWDLVDHGLPGGYGNELIAKLARHYLGDLPTPPTELDRMHHDQVMVELCGNSGQPTVTTRPSRFSVCALPETHPAYRYLVLHVDLRRVDREAGARWAVRWGSYVWVLREDFATFDDGEWQVEASCPASMDIDRWRRYFEFPVSIATRIAHRQAVKVDVNGRTAADIVSHDRAVAADAARRDRTAPTDGHVVS